jgi:hypothetical protein
MGTPTNGKSFKLMSLDLHTIDGGKIARTYHVEDWQGAFRQGRRSRPLKDECSCRSHCIEMS